MDNEEQVIMSRKCNKEKEVVDTKAIEEKALNYLKSFIEDSKRISQFIDDNDKEPCWDGHLYLYAEGSRDKNHLKGRVPVQIKGIEVSRFQSNKWKFKLEKSDLKAYLHEPTFFVVCQVKKDSKERKLFYRELLPDTVRTLLRDMGDNDTRKTLFHPLTENLKEFEDQLMVFMRNSTKMVSFADANPLTFDDVVKKGIKDFSFITPAQVTDRLMLMKYLSTHETYLYAKISKEFDVEIPISGGPARFAFMKEQDEEIKVGDRVFYKGYKNEIKNGRIIISVGNTLSIDLPMDSEDKVKSVVKFNSNSKYLKESIFEAEFAIALHDVGVLTIGKIKINLNVNESAIIEDLRKKLINWKALQNVLDKLHVTVPFDLTKITDEEGKLLDILIDTIGNGNTVKLPGQETALMLCEISNIKLLLWCVAGTDGNCAFGDFFDKTVQISYEYNGKDKIAASPYSYLKNENLWAKADNIDFAGVIPAAQEAVTNNTHCYELINLDVLAMIRAYDSLSSIDTVKGNNILQECYNLNEWLISTDPQIDRLPIHICNKMQIIKRQRKLSEEEIETLKALYVDPNVNQTIKFGILLLLDKHSESDVLFKKLTKEEQESIKGYPIWQFHSKG